MTASDAPATPPVSSKPATLIGWRILALVYDFWPVLALWMLASTAFTLGYTFIGQHDAHQNIPPFSLWSWLLWIVCWAVAGLYATVSWRRGGQTLGMRPWRLRLTADGSQPGWKQLWIRYAIGTLSLLLGGLGFWWAWVDRDRLTWHDRASGTRMVRVVKPAK